MRFARASRRMREMVYDDTRWVARLRSMGCWDEVEARRRFDEAMKRRREQASRASVSTGTGPKPATTTTLFDASVEEERRKAQQLQRQHVADMQDGFETMKITGQPPTQAQSKDPEALLAVIKNVQSVRGHARQEYGRIYGALAPFYFDLAQAKTHTDPIVFQVFRDPERQAQMLSNLQVFSHSDWSQGWRQREEKLSSMVSKIGRAHV